MNKNYQEKAIGLLRTNNAIPEFIEEEINVVFNDRFSVNSQNLFLTDVDFSKIENHSADEIFQAINKLNHFLMYKIDERYRCHLQGILLFKKEQKVILCYSRKVIMCNISQAPNDLNNFRNVIEKRYLCWHSFKQGSSVHYNENLLDLLKATVFIAFGYEGYKPYYEFEKIVLKTKTTILTKSNNRLR